MIMRRFVVLIVSVIAGLGIFFYPQALTWQRELANANRVNTYNAQVVENPQTSVVLQSAYEYNVELSKQPAQVYRAELAETDAEYQAQLRVGSSAEIGQIIIPKAAIRLGIYHGVSDAVLDIGAGHIYGTSLPVGGENTHAVITGHSGLQHSELFTRLDELVVGDEFFINSGGQMKRYVVDDVSVYLPENTGAMNIVPGKDYVTLVTCTPRDINSHRLYVRGERAPLTEADQVAPVRAATPFPWWAVWFSGISGGTIAMCKYASVTKSKKSKQNGIDPQVVSLAGVCHA
jgi:sortase A